MRRYDVDLSRPWSDEDPFAGDLPFVMGDRHWRSITAEAWNKEHAAKHALEVAGMFFNAGPWRAERVREI